MKGELIIMEKTHELLTSIVMGIAGGFIGAGLCGIYYETKVNPDLYGRIEQLQFHNDFLRKCISDFNNLKSKIEND